MEENVSSSVFRRDAGSPRFCRSLVVPVAAIVFTAGCSLRPLWADESLDRVRASGRLAYGCDAEGGGPYAYPDPENPRQVVGFEVELIDRLCGALGPKASLSQGQWDMLLPVLQTGRIDLVLNGYEWTAPRAEKYRATRPYYVFQLQLMAPKTGPLHSWSDATHRKTGVGRWRIGVLGGSAAESFATDAMMAVKNGQIDGTLQDLPAARFYRAQYPSLVLAGPPVGRGYYVMYVRQPDKDLCDALDKGIESLLRSGELRRIYEKYNIWTDAQEELERLNAGKLSSTMRQETLRGWPLLRRYGPTLLWAAGMTVLLSVTAMPLAVAIGLLVALGRLYGPKPLQWVLKFYVEVLRGTPLMLQLFVLFFLLPEMNISLPPLVAGIAGLAINYSAYEAEIYRAGLQAIPGGQMEAALALGMSRRLALRRVIVPQAVRIVIPPVTNDFIALFKDTSVCSVITLVELTKQYSILANSTGGVLEFALASAVLYMAMSLPLSWFSRWFERRLAADPAATGGVYA
jgi:polar amino acid transport system substrate-binding protein